MIVEKTGKKKHFSWGDGISADMAFQFFQIAKCNAHAFEVPKNTFQGKTNTFQGKKNTFQGGDGNSGGERREEKTPSREKKTPFREKKHLSGG